LKYNKDKFISQFQQYKSMNTLHEILTRHNWPEKPVSGQHDFGDIENKAGFELPKDYKDFLLKYAGHETEMGQEYFRLWDREELITLNEEYNVLEYLPGTLGIGSNGGGELIAIEKLGDKDFRIVLTPFVDLDAEFHIEIGESFIDFLVRLDNGKEWFD